MGRPIKRKFFVGTADLSNAGMSIGSITVVNSGTNYSPSTTVTISQPDLQNGRTAVFTASVNGLGNLSLTKVDGGAGYTLDPDVALTNIGTGTGATFSVNLSYADNTGKIAAVAYLPRKGSSASGSVILKQESSHRYLVQNADGDGICKLVAKADGSLLAGEMNIKAQDSAGNNYYVTKLSARRATVYQASGSGYQFSNGQVVGWNIVAASPNVSVKVIIN